MAQKGAEVKKLIIPLCILAVAASVICLVLLKQDANSYTEDDLRAAFDLGHAQGYEVGYVQGHSWGFIEAKETYIYDYDEGYGAGYEAGYWAGYGRGKDWGYDIGYEVGYENGFWAGEEEASKDYAMIAEDSYAHGYVDGYEDGSAGKPSMYATQGY